MSSPVEPDGLRLRGLRAPGMAGPWYPAPALGLFAYLRDPVKVGLALRPRGGAGVVSTARGHANLLVAYGEALARDLFTDVDTWLRPTGGAVVAPPERPRVARMLRTMILMNGPAWQRRRRLSVPPTHRASVLAGMQGDFARTFDEITNPWRRGATIDMSEAMLALSLRNNVRCLMGVGPDEGEPIGRAMGVFTRALIDPGTALTQRLAGWLNAGAPIPGTPYARWVGAAEGLYDTMLMMVKRRRARGGSGDVLGALLDARDEESGCALSDEDVLGELVGLYAAGYETTAHTLTWTLWLCACHPDAARAVQEEVAGALGGRAPTFAEAQSLPRLDATIREAQRVLTVVPSTVPRVTMRDVVLGGARVPAGTGVSLSMIAQHRDPELYRDPYAFVPSRWDALRLAPAALTYKFLPYGAGPRRCLGAVFADYQLRVTLALILQRFAFTPVPGHRVSYRMRQVVLEPDGPLLLRVEDAGRWPRRTQLPEGTVRRLVRLPT